MSNIEHATVVIDYTIKGEAKPTNTFTVEEPVLTNIMDGLRNVPTRISVTIILTCMPST